MPEGHKLFRIALDHRHMINRRIQVTSPQGRFEQQAEELNGRFLRLVESYGKHLVYHWSGKLYMHVHLGLYGKYRWLDGPEEAIQGQVRVRATTADFGFDLNGPNCCELLNKKQVGKLVARIGPDPLRFDSQPRKFMSSIRKSAKPIGALIMDQKVIAGIGNIFRSEILFKLGIHPTRQGNLLSTREIGKIWNLSKKLLKIGVKYNAIITAEPSQVGKPRRKMNKDERLLIYKKETCPECNQPVQVLEIAGRKMFACEDCQT